MTATTVNGHTITNQPKALREVSDMLKMGGVITIDVLLQYTNCPEAELRAAVERLKALALVEQTDGGTLHWLGA